MNSPHKFDHVTTGKKNTDGKKKTSPHFIDLDSSGKLDHHRGSSDGHHTGYLDNLKFT